MMKTLTRYARAVILISIICSVALFLKPLPGRAAEPIAHWLAFSQQAPTAFHPGDTRDFYEIVAVNDGGADSSGTITITNVLPRGVSVDAVNAYAEVPEVQDTGSEPFTTGCEQISGNEVVTVTCKTDSTVPVGRSLVVNINVEIPVEARPGERLVDTTTISGGGAQAVRTQSSTPITAIATSVPFGASFLGDLTDTSGSLDTQAGSHPFAFTTALAFNVGSVNPNENCNRNTTPSCAALNAQVKDIEVALPPGLIGNPTATSYCTQAQFEQNTSFGCPAGAQVGGLYLYFYGSGTAVQYAPVYNIKPPPGQPAELGFTVGISAHIPIFFHVRSGSDYGVTADIFDANQFDAVRMALLSLWGNPSNQAHDALRLSPELGCRTGENGCPSGVALPRPVLRLPTSCSGNSLTMPVTGDSWQDPEAAPFALLAGSNLVAMTGCSELVFYPSLELAIDNHQVGALAGYGIDVKVPQKEAAEGLSTSDVRRAEVALPEGTKISPSAANGLMACSDAQFALKSGVGGHCPDASRIGSVKITTPLLANSVPGTVYIGSPECSPCSPTDAASGGMVRVFLEAEAEGVIVKQAGRTQINQSTGRLTTVFTDTPQLPFSALELSLENGPGAPLTNPTVCGPIVANASLTPWSSATPANITSEPVSIEGCSSPGFSPGFQAGMSSSAHAGSFSGFTMSLSRNDGEQPLGRVSVTTPSGLLGVLQNVEQCPAAQAEAGTCPSGSQIGSGSVVVGPGSLPLTITGSKVYLTGPYAGEPFGLSIVTPAAAGPFVLAGNTNTGSEVVRASIAVDPHTSALTVTSDPLPQSLNGIPLSIRTINIDVNHENFTFNPTNCNTMAVTGAVTSSTGTVSNVSSPFQATGCAALPFKPKFTVSTQGKTSKKNGASLHVRVASGTGQANIAKVKVNLPLQLPSRLSTLQKACIDKVFDANPASCAPVSIVGSATAVTPLLKDPLIGPAYLVSHAGAAFPDLEIVLQGEGIKLILDGNTQIKKGITSSIFKAVPDAPINTFDLNLPEGPHSALAAFGNLCASRLNMPTVITGQNGAVVKQTTKITTTGCPKHNKKRVVKKKA